jgi:hypothetical protein
MQAGAEQFVIVDDYQSDCFRVNVTQYATRFEAGFPCGQVPSGSPAQSAPVPSRAAKLFGHYASLRDFARFLPPPNEEQLAVAGTSTWKLPTAKVLGERTTDLHENECVSDD